MNTLVNFETAKLLKEKGFDKTVVNAYSFNSEKANIPNGEFSNKGEKYISAPTIAEVVMWLYEKHGIWVDVDLMDNSRTYHFDYTIINSKDRDFNDEDCFDSAKRLSTNEKFNSPTEAYEAAIKYTLNNLI